MPSLKSFFYTLKNNDKETDVIAAKVAMVDLVVELNLPLSTLVRMNKVFKDSDIAKRSVEDVPLFGIKFLFFISAVLLF